MKILIDIEQLEREQLVTAETAALLRHHAIRETGSAAISFLLAFGSVVVALGLLGLHPSIWFAIFFGAGFIMLGYLLRQHHSARWGKLSGIWMIVGALVLSVSVGGIIGHPFVSSFAVAVILGSTAILARSRLLIACTALAIASIIGSSTGYWHACYAIFVREPSITILLFSLLGGAAWECAKQLRGEWHHLSITFARMCVVMVNFGFWVGSLWGDTPGSLWQNQELFLLTVPDTVFTIGWALALIAAGVWGARNGRRFMVNCVAVFGSILFYTQWFEHLSTTPFTIMVAGLATIGVGLALWHYNRAVLENEGNA